MSLTNMTPVSEEGSWSSEVALQSIIFGEDQTASPSEYQTNQSVSLPFQIETLPDSSYTLLQPIPISWEEQEDGEWIASFEEANISMSGSTVGEAMDLLAEDIEWAFALFTKEETTLSPHLKHDLAVLRQYLRES